MSKKKYVLITGSAGLIGAQAARYFLDLGFKVVGIDNDMRSYFFGPEASTDWNRSLLESQYKNYIHYDTDIRDEEEIEKIFQKYDFDLIIHSAAQPSHDWAMKEPLTDFSVNATGTLIMLEAFRKYCPEAVFIFTSTNKVYGDTPNLLPLIELETRYEIDPNHKFSKGIDETMTIDDSKHSIFGASKVAADVMVQEYGRYFDLKTCTMRGGCLTGPGHAGAELHGFLAYLVKCIAEGRQYTIFGYKGKQVRDNIHSYDLVTMFHEFYKNPRIGEVYNVGGSRYSNISMMEAIEKIENYLGKKGNIVYSDQNRSGDHMWYISDVSKFQKHYPNWKYTYDIDAIIEEICEVGHFTRSDVKISKKSPDAPAVFVSAHVTEGYGPVQALKRYLIRNFSKFIFVEHPFTYTEIEGSKLESFRGSLVSTQSEQQKVRSETLSYLYNAFLTLYWYVKEGRQAKIFIGVGALNALVGAIIKVFGFDIKLVYYSVDYSPKRFESSLLNTLYHFADVFSVKFSDYVWNVSTRMANVRKNQGLSSDKNIVIPTGVSRSWHSKGRVKRDKNTLIISEHITKDKGIQTVIKALRGLSNRTKLIVVGTGPYLSNLKGVAKRHKLEKRVEFVEGISFEEYTSLLKQSGVGICLRGGDETNTPYYSDPTSPKEFLSSNLPIIVSNSLWIAEDVKKHDLGGVTQLKEKEIVDTIKKVLRKSNYDRFSKNIEKYVTDFSWGASFNKGFEKL